jgi:hypothetical protein
MQLGKLRRVLVLVIGQGYIIPEISYFGVDYIILIKYYINEFLVIYYKNRCNTPTYAIGTTNGDYTYMDL